LPESWLLLVDNKWVHKVLLTKKARGGRKEPNLGVSAEEKKDTITNIQMRLGMGEFTLLGVYPADRSVMVSRKTGGGTVRKSFRKEPKTGQRTWRAE